MEENLRLNDSAPLPDGATSLKPNQVLINVHVSAVNPVDFKFAEAPYIGRFLTGRPATPGMDFAGRVAAIGSGDQNTIGELKVGDLVYGRLSIPQKFGTMAEYTIADRAACLPIPPGMDMIEAAATPSVGLTAFQMIEKLGDGAGRNLFINGGSGGCGIFGIQIAKAKGWHVTTTCSTPNVQLCKDLGADIVIDYKTQDVVKTLIDGQPMDFVIDNVGEPRDLYWKMPSFSTPKAPYVQVGGRDVDIYFVLENFYKRYWPSWLGGGQRPWEFNHLVNKAEDFAKLGQLIQEKKVRVIIDEVIELDDGGPVRAYAKLRTQRARGKIVVKLWK